MIEAGDGVGGTWYWNRYPGARCDVESLEYSYSFSEELQQEWEWTERYPAQPEILRYLEHVADRFDLRPRHPARHARRRGGVRRAAAAGRSAPTAAGVTAQFLIMATGCLSSSQVPEFPGSDALRGRVLPHRALAARGRRLRGQARRRDRHRLVRHPVDPADRRAGRAAHRLPAHAELHRARAQRPARPGDERGARPTTRACRARSARESHARHPAIPSNDRSALEVPDEERERSRGALGARRLRHARAASPTCSIDPRPTSTAPSSSASKIRETRRATPRSPSAHAARLPDRHQAPVRRHRLLRDVQPRQRHARRHPRARRSRDHADRRADRATRRTSSTRSCSPPASTR